MAELICVFCNNFGDNLILFTGGTLMMCKKLLNVRKKHNLQYQDVVLPDKELEGGYHKQCCIQFISSIGKRSEPAKIAEEEKSEEKCPVTSTPKPIILRQPIIKLERLDLKIISSGQSKKQLENNNCCKKSLIGHRGEYHQKAFKKLNAFIMKNVVKKERCYFLTYLHEIYKDFLRKKSNRVKSITVETLGDEIMKVETEVKFFLVQNTRILASKKLEVIDDELFEKLKEENILLTNQLNMYQGNFQGKYYADDEAEKFDDVDIQD